MDKFFEKRVCDRCGKDLSGGRIMSMFNDDCICLECKEKEKKLPGYKEAEKQDMVEYCRRNNIMIVKYGNVEKNDTKNK